jgi:acetyl-CoA carboxylase biotin carboxyl carrier protein
MEVTQLARLLAALRESDIRDVHWEEPGWSLQLTRRRRNDTHRASAGTVASQYAPSAQAPEPEAASARRRHANATMPGVFLDHHPGLVDAIDTAALRDGRATVKKTAVLGLLQVGVLLLPVTAPEDGTVTASLAANGTVVGYGKPLFELEI